jgi:ABC-type branched-subunit amino acid transport system permease subunit
VTGAVVGPVVITVISEVLRRFTDAQQIYGLSGFVLALLFLLIIIFRSDGLMGEREFDFRRLGQLIVRSEAQGGEPEPSADK